MGGGSSETPETNEDFSYVSPVVKYLLFVFNFIFWVSLLETFPSFCVQVNHLSFVGNHAALLLSALFILLTPQ